jgi:hypothetical protein
VKFFVWIWSFLVQSLGLLCSVFRYVIYGEFLLA